MVVYMLSTKTAKQTDGGGRGVELREFMLFDGLPIARGSRVDRGRFEDCGGDTVGERAIDDIAEKRVGVGEIEETEKRLTCDP